MDRRTALKLLPAAIGSTSCALGSRSRDELSYLFANHLAILGLGSAWTPTGSVGQIGDSSTPPIIGVAPNAKSVSIIQTWPSQDVPAAIIRQSGVPERHILLPVRAGRIAISNSGRIFVIRSNQGLFEVPNNAEPIDLTPGISGFDITTADRLRTSEDGNTLLISGGNRWAVFDLRIGNVIRLGAGRSPSLSPDGQNIAYVTDDKKLAVGPVNDKHELLPVGSRTFHGVGSWSPDGKWLLAGATIDPFMIVSVRLVAVETSSGAFVDLLNIDPDLGGNSLWIDRSLLDPV